MKNIFLIVLLACSLAACQKTQPKEFIKVPDAPIIPLSDWEIPVGLNDINSNYRSAFVKDDLLYISGNDKYIVVDKSNTIIKTETFDSLLDAQSDIYMRWNNDFLVVIDNQQLLIKHLTSGAEKYIKGRFTDMNGAKVMLSKYNNLYCNSDFNNDADSANHAYHIRHANNQIMLDTLPDLLSSRFSPSTGIRYQVMGAPGAAGLVIYDDLNKTYNLLTNNTYTPFLPIQEIDNNTSILMVRNSMTDIMQMHIIENGQIVNSINIENDSSYVSWMQIYYLSGDLLFFTGSNQANLLSYNLTTRQFTYYLNKTPNEYIRQIIEYNDKLYLISTAGIMFKPFVYE